MTGGGGMRPFDQMPLAAARAIRTILFDVDDTLTTRGKLTAQAYSAMWALSRAGFRLVPVTGRPAGWCDMMLRQWPVAAVICENGAFALMRDAQNAIHTLTHPNAARDPAPRLEALARAVRAAVPEARISRDQRFRAYDLAFDFAEDEPRLPDASVEAILAACRREGAQCKLSSIHVNAWYGEYDKLSMTLNYFEHEKVENARSHALFFGDSPNDEPMFAYFPNACGVENVLDYAHSMASMPAYIVKGRGGQGFARAARTLIEKVGGVYDPGL